MTDTPSGLIHVLGRFKPLLIAVAVMSGVINILYLTGSFYMMQVYDRVIPSRSVPTLIALSALAFALYGFQSVIDFIRGRVLARMAGSFDVSLSQDVYALMARLPLRMKKSGDGQQPVRDLDSIRNFLSGPGLASFFDVPWILIYLGLCFAFHPLIGWSVVVGVLILAVLAILTEVLTRRLTGELQAMTGPRSALIEASRRNAEAIAAMGMKRSLQQHWTTAQDAYLAKQQKISDITGVLGGISKFVRFVIQSAVLGLGAYLVIGREATPGIIIACSILSARALAPVDLVIAHWRGFVDARLSARRLFGLMKAIPEPTFAHDLPAPTTDLRVEGISVAPPGVQQILVSDVAFTLKAGEALGVVGASASGKSTLARAITGAWQPIRGRIRLDNAALDQWDQSRLGRHIGYLPQDVELFDGSIFENIARFDSDASADAVYEAARAAGVHDMILRLPKGYETRIGEGGASLSAGQRQRIALARALYGNPFLVVLDEPNANLDRDGEDALTRAITGVRERGGIVVVIAHHPAALLAVDSVLVMEGGRMKMLRPRDEVVRPMPKPGVPRVATPILAAEG